MSSPTITGGCLCGAVRYEVNGPLRPVINCHCGQCRRTSGHFVAATACQWSDLTLVNEDGLRWYQSSEQARRGFCTVCGSSLFWDGATGDGATDTISIMAGTLDGKTGLETSAEIYIEDAGDYYRRDENVRQIEGSSYQI